MHPVESCDDVSNPPGLFSSTPCWTSVGLCQLLHHCQAGGHLLQYDVVLV
jgi:hypothetical protein